MGEISDSSWMDQPIELPHEFEIELNHLVTTNDALVLQAINTEEDAELSKNYADNPFS
jgi:hypothetical protein